MYSAATPLRPPSLHDALPIYIQALDSKGLRQRRRYAGIFCPNFILKTLSSGLSLPGNRTEGSLVQREALGRSPCSPDRKSTRLNSSHVAISYAVFFLTNKK